MTNFPQRQQVVRFGLTLANFRRFESIIQVAVLSYPQPVEVDWSQSDLRFTTYIARLRDAITGLKTNSPQWASWMFGDRFTKLSALVVRPHPTNPSRILIGDHEATKPQVAPVSSEVEAFNSVLGRASATISSYQTPQGEQAKLRLATSADPEMLQRAVVAYAELASMKVEGLPRFYITRDIEEGDNDFLVRLRTFCDGYDVAVQETEKEFIIL